MPIVIWIEISPQVTFSTFLVILTFFLACFKCVNLMIRSENDLGTKAVRYFHQLASKEDPLDDIVHYDKVQRRRPLSNKRIS